MYNKLKNPGMAFVSPTIVVLSLLVLFPLGYTAYLSFVDQSGSFIGLSNFEKMLGSRQTKIAFWNTIFYVTGSMVLQVLVGTGVGILLNQKFKGRLLIRTLILIPWVIPGIVAATTWSWMFHGEFGIINFMLMDVGIIDTPIKWLTSSSAVMPSLILVNTWKMFPFVAIMVLAGLQSIPAHLYEAAKMDGATFKDEVRHIMIPQLKPVLTSVSLLLLIWGVNSITIIYPMTGGGPANRSLITPIQIYKQAFEFFNFNNAAALSLVFFVSICFLIVLYLKLTSEKDS